MSVQIYCSSGPLLHCRGRVGSHWCNFHLYKPHRQKSIPDCFYDTNIFGCCCLWHGCSEWSLTRLVCWREVCVDGSEFSLRYDFPFPVFNTYRLSIVGLGDILVDCGSLLLLKWAVDSLVASWHSLWRLSGRILYSASHQGSLQTRPRCTSAVKLVL